MNMVELPCRVDHIFLCGSAQERQSSSEAVLADGLSVVFLFSVESSGPGTAAGGIGCGMDPHRCLFNFSSADSWSLVMVGSPSNVPSGTSSRNAFSLRLRT